MNAGDRQVRRLAGIVALVALAGAAPAVAQSVSDYRLPPASPTPRPDVQGPVDPENPAPAPPAATAPPPVSVPTARPTPRATAAPQETPSPRAAAQPAARSAAPASGARARQDAAPGPVASAVPTFAPALPAGLPTASEPAAAPVAPPAATETRPAWLFGALALFALLLAGGFVLARRRKRPAAAEPEPVPAAPGRPEPAAPPVRVEPLPEAAFGTPASRLPELRLEPQNFSRTLLNASMAYRLAVTNAGGLPTGPLAIAADLGSAHASVPAERQLEPGADAAVVHRIDMLAAGETVELAGELRLPMAEILPVDGGAAAPRFVPLARFRVEDGDGVSATHVFAIGEPGRDGRTLRPLRVDSLWGVCRELAWKTVATRTAMPLDDPEGLV